MAQLTYTLVVTKAAYGSQSSYSAYQFALALIDQGHILKSVFFYQDGVYNANSLLMPAHDEFNLMQAWQKLAQQHQVVLETCVAASLRRGIISEQDANQHNQAQHNLANEFIQSGLGALAQAMLSQDRVVQF